MAGVGDQRVGRRRQESPRFLRDTSAKPCGLTRCLVVTSGELRHPQERQSHAENIIGRGTECKPTNLDRVRAYRSPAVGLEWHQENRNGFFVPHRSFDRGAVHSFLRAWKLREHCATTDSLRRSNLWPETDWRFLRSPPSLGPLLHRTSTDLGGPAPIPRPYFAANKGRYVTGLVWRHAVRTENVRAQNGATVSVREDFAHFHERIEHRVLWLYGHCFKLPPLLNVASCPPSVPNAACVGAPL